MARRFDSFFVHNNFNVGRDYFVKRPTFVRHIDLYGFRYNLGLIRRLFGTQFKFFLKTKYLKF
jgi:hypothetical protein